MPAGKECCNIPSGALHGESSCHGKHDCCSTSVSFFKTSDYFSPVKQEIKVFAPVLSELGQPEMPIEQLKGACLIACNDTSPPFTAVKLFLQFHQMRALPDVA
jgi:hypothetical protein